MNTIIRSALFTLLLPLAALAQCPFDNSYYLTLSPSCPGTSTATCVFGGEYVEVNVVAGNVYTFSTCGGLAFDTEITVYDNTGTIVLGYNDDFCGLQSEVTWTASYTGIVNVMLDQFPCTSNFSCMNLAVTCNPQGGSGNGCNTNTTICQAGVAGPFGFSTPGPDPGNCLDWFATSQFTYIILYITQSGPLNLLIQGDVPSGFLDVAIYNIPAGQTPCNAILNPANLLGCNYALFSDGCNQFGTDFPCGSSVPSPNVVAGQELMIIVEDWLDGASSTFTLQLGPPPNAQTGAANPTITTTGPFCINSAAVQLNAVDMGGNWSGNGVSPGGIFNPAAAGVGTTSVSYSIGSGICNATNTAQIVVFNIPPVNPSNSGPYCPGETIELSTQNVPGANYAWSGPNFSSNLQSPTITNAATNATGIYTVNVSVDACTANGTTTVTVAPAPISGPIFHD